MEGLKIDQPKAVQDPKAPEPTEETVVKAHTRKPKRTVEELTEGLLVEKIILDLTGEEQICGTCGSKLKRIGEKLVRREIETTRKQIRLLEYYTVTYACPGCEKETGYAHMYEHRAPPPLLKDFKGCLITITLTGAPIKREFFDSVYRRIPVRIMGAQQEPGQPCLIQPKMEQLMAGYAGSTEHIVSKLARLRAYILSSMAMHDLSAIAMGDLAAVP